MAKHGTFPEFLYQCHLEVSDKVHLNFGFHEDEDLNEDEACEEANDSDAVMKARTNSMKAVTKTLISVPMQTTIHIPCEQRVTRVSFDPPRRSKETLLAGYNHRVNKMNKG